MEKDIVDYKWIKVVERQNSPLFLNLICSGITDEYTQSVLGEKLGSDFYVYLNGEVLITSESSEKLLDKFEKFIVKEGVSGIKIFFEKWYKISEKLIKDSENSEKYITKTNQEISDYFQMIIEDYYSLSTALMVVFPIEKYLEKNIKDILNKRNRKNIDEELFILTKPNRKNDNELENDSLEKIAEIIRKDKISLDKTSEKIDNLIFEHIRLYGWLNSDRFFNREWSKKDIIDRLSYKILEVKKETQIIDSNFMEELELSLEEKEYVDISKESVFFRTYRMNIFVKAGFLLIKLLSEIADRIGVDFNKITYMTPSEIISSLNNNNQIPIIEISQRMKEYGYYVKENEIKTITGEEYKNFKKKYFSENKKELSAELKGIIAYKGKISGIVKIVRATTDLDKVKYGDILVAPMTIPSFIPAMEKASSFITDEGGILCHAAIVAREMKKPCIIGTRNATSVLKDGDMVEVDADNGIVRIIK